GVGQNLLGPAEGRRRREVELAVVETGHRREPGAERVEADDVRVHLPEPQGERVDALLQPATGLLEQRLLRLELGAPGLHLDGGIRQAVRVRGMPADEERAGEKREREGECRGPEPARLELQMADLAAVTIEKYQLHPAAPPWLECCVPPVRNRARSAPDNESTANLSALSLLDVTRQPRYRKRFPSNSVLGRPGRIPPATMRSG